MPIVKVNGKNHEIEEGATLIDLIKVLQLPSLSFGIAAAVNGELIDRGHWEITTLRDSDSIDIIRAFQGG